MWCEMTTLRRSGMTLFAALGLFLAGCGSDSSDTTAGDLAQPAARPAPPRAPVEPLQVIAAPDVNALGLLDKTGPGANQWTWEPITRAQQKLALQQMGKALFWDMQVGGDGIQACATCHYNAGADNRIEHQLSPGLKANDQVADLTTLNSKLTSAHFAGTTNGVPNGGMPVSEADLIALGALPDALNGSPGSLGSKPSAQVDVNDVISSQGIRGGIHQGVTSARVDLALLKTSDPGFDVTFSNPAEGVPHTVRRVEPRNSPSVLNAVFNLRNFWDGRADMYFNGVNPLGFRDPDARVKVVRAGVLGSERLDLPFSSLASQAVGPIESHFEMVFGDPDNALPPRAHRELGKKLTLPGTVPLRGQLVAVDDSMLGTLRAADGRGLNTSYNTMIQTIFHPRFWDAPALCLGSDGAATDNAPVNGVCPAGEYTLAQYNFSLFFGLAVQAYEATLVTGQTIVDLIAGGIATGTVTNGRNVVNVGPPAGSPPGTPGLSLDGCIALVALNTNAAQQALATNLCTAHYAKFIDPKATTGSESALAPFPVANNTAIGGCATPPNCTVPAARLPAAQATLQNVNRGLGRFFAGATACAVCHFNPEFTGATVGVMTGFGVPPEVLNPGQARRVELRAVMERMVTFNGAAAVYDTGFYNIGVRPSPEDLSLGDQIGGVPLALGKLFDIMNGGDATGFNPVKIGTLAAPAPGSIAASIAGLQIPTSPTNLAPIPFPFRVGCGVGLVGGGNANNNPNINCAPNVIPGERLLRNGAFKAPGLRNVKFTGPYMHNGSKMNLRQVMEFYKTAGHFTNLNLNNLDAGMRVFNLGIQDEAAVMELMETGLTDWRVAYQSGVFDHPELCVPNGHDPATGKTRLAAIPAVGRTGSAQPIATFEEMVRGTAGARANNLNSACTVVDQTTAVTLDAAGVPQTVTSVQAMADSAGLSNIDGMLLEGIPLAP